MITENSQSEETARTAKVRIQLDLSEKMCALLDDLVDRTSAASRAEVIRRALSLYAILCEEKESGKRIEVVDPRDKSRERLILP